MRFALITDVHFGPVAHFDGKLRKLSHEAGRLSRAVVDALQAEADLDLLINLGDVVEDENRSVDRARYGEFVGILEQLKVPLLHVAGNHDQVHLTEDDLRQLWRHSGPLHYVRDVAGVRFIVLNTLETKDVAVHLPEAQLTWLRGELARAESPVVVLMHHPASEMLLEGNRWFSKAPHICRVAERRALRRILEESGKVVAVFNGHVHWNHVDVIGNIPYFTLQSLIENLDDDAPGRPARAYAVCDLDRHGLHVDVRGEEPLRVQFARG